MILIVKLATAALAVTTVASCSSPTPSTSMHSAVTTSASTSIQQPANTAPVISTTTSQFDLRSQLLTLADLGPGGWRRTGPHNDDRNAPECFQTADRIARTSITHAQADYTTRDGSPLFEEDLDVFASKSALDNAYGSIVAALTDCKHISVPIGPGGTADGLFRTVDAPHLGQKTSAWVGVLDAKIAAAGIDYEMAIAGDVLVTMVWTDLNNTDLKTFRQLMSKAVEHVQS